MPLYGDKKRKYDREWIQQKLSNPENRKKWNQQRKERRQRARVEAYKILGGKCVYCNCDNFGALEINHIHGGGGKDKRRPEDIHNAIRRGEDITDLELTCRICNAWHYLKKIKNIDGDWKIIWLDSVTGSMESC